MEARAKMQERIDSKSAKLRAVALELQISERLLESILNGGYTHPGIAKRLQREFGLTDEEASQLVSPTHREIPKATNRTPSPRRPEEKKSDQDRLFEDYWLSVARGRKIDRMRRKH